MGQWQGETAAGGMDDTDCTDEEEEQRFDRKDAKKGRRKARVGSDALVRSNLWIPCVFAVITLSLIREIRVIRGSQTRYPNSLASMVQP